MAGQQIKYITVNLPAGATGLATAVDCRAVLLSGLIMPTTWTAAAITAQGSMDDITYNNIYTDGGTEVSLTVAASRFVAFTGTILDALNAQAYVKLRSGTTGTPVDQTTARVLQLVAWPR